MWLRRGPWSCLGAPLGCPDLELLGKSFPERGAWDPELLEAAGEWVLGTLELGMEMGPALGCWALGAARKEVPAKWPSPAAARKGVSWTRSVRWAVQEPGGC